MTINEAKNKGLKKVRKPYWNEQAYLEIGYVSAGVYGPWATLIDPPAQREKGPDQVPIWQADDKKDDWEPIL
jgi:hypothetical protein